MVHGAWHVHLARDRHRLAVVEGLDLGELVGVGLDQVGELVHQERAAGGWELRPRPLERRGRGLDGAVHVLDPSVRHLRDRVARRRVDRLEGPPLGGLHPIAADQQAVWTGAYGNRGRHEPEDTLRPCRGSW